MKWPPRTSVNVYASSAVHSAFTVGLLRANMMGRSLMEPMALITSGEKRRPAPATPGAINQRLQRELEQTKPKAKSSKRLWKDFWLTDDSGRSQHVHRLDERLWDLLRSRVGKWFLVGIHLLFSALQGNVDFSREDA